MITMQCDLYQIFVIKSTANPLFDTLTGVFLISLSVLNLIILSSNSQSISNTMNPVLNLWAKTNSYSTVENTPNIPPLSGQKISSRQARTATERKRPSRPEKQQRPVIVSAGHRYPKRRNGRKLVSRTKVEFLPAIDSGDKYHKYSSKSRSRTMRKDRSHRKVYRTERQPATKHRDSKYAERIRKEQSRSQKKFRRYIDELEKSVKKQHAATDTAQPLYQTTDNETLLPPHLNMMEQHSYQTQSFAPKQVYANTINININNNAQNAANQQHGDYHINDDIVESEAIQSTKSNQDGTINILNHSLQSMEHLDEYWSEPISFPKTIHSPKPNGRLDSYRSPPRVTEHITTVPANLSINDYIINWTADKQEFQSLHTFSRYKLKQLNDLFVNRDHVENFEITQPPPSGSATHSTRLSRRGSLVSSRETSRSQFRSHKDLFNRRMFPAKTTTDKIITETSFISALCLDILSQMADKTENTNSELLTRITTELAKCVFHQPPNHKWKNGVRSLTVVTGEEDDGMHRKEQKWFEDLKNITLDKLCGLRCYKEKWFSMSSSIGNVQSDFLKVESASKWVDKGKEKKELMQMRSRAFKVWKLFTRRKILALRMCRYLHDAKSMQKGCFQQWKRKVAFQQKVYYNRKIRYLEQEQLRLKAEVEYLQETQASSKEQTKKFRTAMSVMAEYLHCDGAKQCEERTALRIHQMVKKMKLTLADSGSFLRELKFEEYLREFPSEQELLLKFDKQDQTD